jgi:hypothetical protein
METHKGLIYSRVFRDPWSFPAFPKVSPGPGFGYLIEKALYLKKILSISIFYKLNI